MNATNPVLERRDFAVGGMLFLLLLGMFSYIGGGPVSNDELKYLAAAVDSAAMPHLLNRYVHIWLEKCFIVLTGDARSGMALFWATLVSETTACVWFAVRLLRPGSGRWVAALAVALFLLQPVVFRYIGVTYADYTVMLWVTLAVVVCLAGLRAGSETPRWIPFLLGVLLVLAVRSKETGIIVILLPLALCWRQEGFRVGAVARNAPWWLLGVGCAQSLLMTVDALLLGDFWFSLRPASIQALLGFNLGAHEHVRGNWFSWLLMSDLALPLVFYIAAIPLVTGRDTGLRVIWLLPLALIFFLTLTNISGRWNIIPRYLAPVIPLLCVLGAGYFALAGYQGLWRLRLRRSVVVAGGLAVLLTAMAFGWSLRDLSSGVPLLRGWDPYTFVLNIHYPIVVALCLACFLLLRFGSVFQGRVLLGLLLLGLLPMLAAWPNNISFSSRILERRLQPLTELGAYIRIRPLPRLLLSPSISDHYGMLESSTLLRIYLDPPQVLPRDSVVMSRHWSAAGDLDYAIGTRQDYQRWLAEGLPAEHELRRDRAGITVLVCLRPCAEPVL